MGAINAMKHQFHGKFGTHDVGGKIGFVFAIYTIGNIVGSFGAGPVADKWGRRAGMAAGAVLIILGTCISATAQHLNQFMGGRFVLGVGVAFSASESKTNRSRGNVLIKCFSCRSFLCR